MDGGVDVDGMAKQSCLELQPLGQAALRPW